MRNNNPPPFLKKPAVAAMFGVTTRCIELWMQSNRIPYYRIGRSVRFDRAMVEKHLQQNCAAGAVVN